MSTSGPSTPASPSSSGLDVARLLLQKVSRTFYGSKGAILIDQLIQKEAFRDEELGKRLGMPSREVSKYSHRLIKDELVSLHRRSELKPGAPKASMRTYYYLDFSKSVDVVKWRMWKVQQTIDVKLRNELDAQGYLCPLCKASYTPLDAAQLYDPSRNLLACSICSTEVTNNENEEQVKGNKDRMQRLNRQLKGIVDLLKKLENFELPRFDIERYLAIHGPALGATAQAQANASGQQIPIQPNVKVQIAGDDDEILEKQKRELELKEKRAQNLLPSWIAKSTINNNGTTITTTTTTENGESTKVEEGDREGDAEREQGIVPEQHEQPQEEPFQSERETLNTIPTSSNAGGGLGSVDIGGFGAAMSFYEQGGEEDEDEEGGNGKPIVENGAGDDLDAYYASLEAQNLGTGTGGEGTPLSGSNYDSPVTTGGGGGAVDSPLTFNYDPVGEQEVEANTTSSGQGKRSRQESTEFEDSAAVGTKKFKGEDTPQNESVQPDVVNNDEEEEEEGEFDQVEGEGEGEGEEEENMDPNQLISVNGKMLPYSQVTEDMTSEMTADEYSAYWDVYARLNE
ncbi:hypothetical protein JCM5350_005798 [Sporobolomyces pararoseus]